MNSLQNLPDNDIVNNIKNDVGCNANLIELVNRHKKLYYSICSKYDKNERVFASNIKQEIYYNFFNAAKKFDENRGMKFSTFLASHVDFLCKTIACRQKTKIAELHENIPCEIGYHKVVEDIKRSLYISILSIKDKRAKKILFQRYLSDNDKTKTFCDIGKNIKLSTRMVKTIHDKYIKYLKKIQKNYE